MCGRGKSSRSAVCVGLALLISACQTADHTRLQPLEPQSLVGEWSGKSSAHFDVQWLGDIVLTITRVEDDRVFGTLERWSAGGGGGGRNYRKRSLQGTLSGNELKIGPLHLTVDGGIMTGRRVGGAVEYADVRLTRLTAGTRQAPSGTPGPPGVAGSINGVYAGEICLGPSPNGDPARCFWANATVRDGKIVGEWPGREGTTVKLTGEVSTPGDVKIEWHSERPDGSQFRRANLSGTIQNGRLDANGAFFNGRTVSIKWTLTMPESDSSEPESDGHEHAHPSGLKRK